MMNPLYFYEESPVEQLFIIIGVLIIIIHNPFYIHYDPPEEQVFIIIGMLTAIIYYNIR